ncbi:SDR family oxidoreductase [Nocardia sp. NPDC051570]|uniref:SDR family oxidoreductase n=1 Tax=Nocardia sp. NPDC051570 TaxID=3364324 RepID=UPI0037BD9C58
MVLVTGGSGFVGAHCIVQLLNAGYRVRTTVRSLERAAEVRAMVATGGAEPGDTLSFAAADLTSDAGWPAAVADCDFVLHVASPFPAGIPKHEDELVVPAREGALRVLRAARDAGVKRVVLTSSFVAISYGHPPTDRPFTEQDWTHPDHARIGAYVKSKTLAERAAWDFIASEGGALELAVINPVSVFGPVLGPDYSSSIQFVKRLLEGALPGVLGLSISVVDVRDIADLHLRAMISPEANGERFVGVAGASMTMREIADVLRAGMGDAASRVPTRVLPNWLVRLASVVDPPLKQVVPDLGRSTNGSNEKARRLLGWAPRSNEEAIIATAESLVQLGLLQNSQEAA